MSYMYVKAVCLFCNATIQGAEERMNKANNYRYIQGDIVWEEKAPEYVWAYYDNVIETEHGLHRSARFYLCSEHQKHENWVEAFRWLETHLRRPEVINARVTEENVRKELYQVSRGS